MMTSSQMPLTAGKPEHRWWILAVLATAQLMVALDATVVSIALPHAQATLHFSSANRRTDTPNPSDPFWRARPQDLSDTMTPRPHASHQDRPTTDP
jgi:hypothetical protein